MVELAPRSKVALYAKAMTLGVREGSLEHRILGRELRREKSALRAARAHDQVLAEMQEAAAEEARRERKKFALGKARLAKKAHPKINALRRKHVADFLGKIDGIVKDGRQHRASMQMQKVTAKADARRQANLAAQYQSMKRSRS